MAADFIARGLAARAEQSVTVPAAQAAASASAAAASASAANGSETAAAASAASAAASVASASTFAPSPNTQALMLAVRNNGFFPRPPGKIAAADMPTFTLGASGAVSTINGNGLAAPSAGMTSNRIAFLGGAGTLVSGINRYRARGASTGGAEGWLVEYCAFEFEHTGAAFEISFTASFTQTANNLRILVDDVIAGTATVPSSTGQHHYLHVSFPASRARRIRVESSGGSFKGVNSASPSDIAATGRNYPLVTVIGDSFAEGTGAGSYYNGEAAAMLRALGFNVGLAAVGGTGLLNPSTTAGRVAWHHANRVRDLTLAGVTDAISGAAASPAMGVVQMSLNDASTPGADWSPHGATLEEAALDRALYLIDQWIAARPGKPLVFFGPMFPSGLPANSPSLDIFRLRDATQQACWAAAKDNVWFIDRLMPAMREGVWSSAGSQAALYTSADGTHPNQAGHAFDALTTAAQLRGLILREFA